MCNKKRGIPKKILVITLSLMMMVMFSGTSVFALNQSSDNMGSEAQPNNGIVTIKNVEADATVTAYKIVTKDANNEWAPVISGSIEDVTNPTADEIEALAGRTSELGTGTVLDPSTNGDYTKQLTKPGMYLVLVSKTNAAKVYNPMVVSVNYKDAQLQGGTVDAEDSYSIGNDAYAKSSTPTLDKKITSKNNTTYENGKDGDTAAVGDKVGFTINSTIPSYSDAYTDPKFEITDTVSEGLSTPTNIEVKAGTVTLKKGEQYTITPDSLGESDKTFTITFSKSYLQSLKAAQGITVTYDSTILEAAKRGVAANPNDVTLTYSNNPTDSSSHGTKDDHTYHYTFDINGKVDGKTESEEFVKVGVDKLTGDVVTEKKSDTTYKLLSGAEFELQDKDGKKIQEATTGEDGQMNFTGIDAGEYYIVETKAPDGYAKNSSKVKVEIKATIDKDGKLTSYTIQIGGKTTQTYTTTNPGTSTATAEKTGPADVFQNTNVGTLPSTGGRGTMLFTVLGAALIACAGFIIYRRRRNTAK